jgi:hypothetical protein
MSKNGEHTLKRRSTEMADQATKTIELTIGVVAKYYDRALQGGDYYTKDRGVWGGKGAEMLGLREEVARKQFMNLKADAPFYEAAFNARLASKLLAPGYGIRRTDRDFELESVSRELIEKFSKRTRKIEELAIKEQTILGAKARALVYLLIGIWEPW